jgi:DNA invertase Pin-like site-specific DNA recombinase
MDALAGCTRVYEDHASGSSTDRPELRDLLAAVRSGDTIRVYSMDRLARSLTDLLALVQEFNAKGCTVVFVREAQTFKPEGADPMSRLMLGVLGAVAEFERAIIRERQAAGIAKAKAQGVYKGRAPVLVGAKAAEARQLLLEGIAKAEVARRVGVARSVLYEWLKTDDAVSAAA